MKSWTLDEILCAEVFDYLCDEEIEKLFDGRGSLTVLEILDMDDAPLVARVRHALSDGEHVIPVLEKVATRTIAENCLTWADDWLSGNGVSIESTLNVLDAAGNAVVFATRRDGLSCRGSLSMPPACHCEGEEDRLLKIADIVRDTVLELEGMAKGGIATENEHPDNGVVLND